LPRGLSAVVFDLDGTLVDSLPLTFRAFREALRPWLDHEPTDEEIYSRFGPADHRIVADWAPPGREEEAVRRLMAAYERGVDSIVRYQGVDRMLSDLCSAGFRLALCTGRGRPSTSLILERLGMAALFETIVTGEEVPRAKPEPDGLLHTCRLLGAPASEVLYCGDSVKDVDAGLAAGCFTVAALWAGTEPETPEFDRAHARARNPTDIPPLAARLSGGRSGTNVVP
jgi:HAD superfamily hydrolase (TIGR01549 family)